MSRAIRFRAEAVVDIAEAFSWYQSRLSGLGLQFEAAIDVAIELLRQAPEAGPVVHREVRRVLLRRFPYAVYYTLTPELIEIRAVAHMHRDPAHWKKRR